jgi:hypothetical protein
MGPKATERLYLVGAQNSFCVYIWHPALKKHSEFGNDLENDFRNG